MMTRDDLAFLIAGILAFGVVGFFVAGLVVQADRILGGIPG